VFWFSGVFLTIKAYTYNIPGQLMSEVKSNQCGIHETDTQVQHSAPEHGQEANSQYRCLFHCKVFLKDRFMLYH